MFVKLHGCQKHVAKFVVRLDTRSSLYNFRPAAIHKQVMKYTLKFKFKLIYFRQHNILQVSIVLLVTIFA